jgi:hypothetical protein
VLVSVVQRERVPPIPPLAELRAAYDRHGLILSEARPAVSEVAALRSLVGQATGIRNCATVTLLRVRRPS